MTRIHVPDGDPMMPVWQEVIALSVPSRWTLIGGLMVQTFQHEHDVPIARATTDIDALLEITTRPDQPERFAAQAEERGYVAHDDDVHDVLDGNAMTHRLRRERFVLDIVVPGDGRRSRRTPRTIGVGQPAFVKGGEFALARTETILMRAGDARGEVRRPDLLGALLIKSRAAVSDTTRRADRHGIDLAHLWSLVEDPAQLRDDPGRCGTPRARGAVSPGTST